VKLEIRFVFLAFVPLWTWVGCANPPQLTASDAGFVRWIGLDARPLAVGSQLIVTLEIATDAGVQPSYSVDSSNPDVVTIEDAGDERLLLLVRGEGTTTLELKTADEKADLLLTASIPVALTVSDAEHLAAGVDATLGSSFQVLGSSEELLQAVVLDASGQPLNSWGLVQSGAKTNGLQVSTQEPEQFILAQRIAAIGTFEAVLTDPGDPPADGGLPVEDAGVDLDAGSTANYLVTFVPSVSWVSLLRGGPAGLTVLAQALNDAGPGESIEVFGVDDWEFSCFPPATCTINRLSPSVVSLTFEAGSGNHDLTASSSSQALSLTVVIPVIP
jgi:hypothetical protein